MGEDLLGGLVDIAALAETYFVKWTLVSSSSREEKFFTSDTT